MLTRRATTIADWIGWLLLATAAGCQSTHMSSGGCNCGGSGVGRLVPGADGYQQVHKHMVPAPDPAMQNRPKGIPPEAIVSTPSAGYGHNEPGRGASADRSAAAPRRPFPLLRALPMPLRSRLADVPSGPELVPDMGDTGHSGFRLRPLEMLPQQPLTEPLETQQKLVPGMSSRPKVLQNLNESIRRLFRRTGQSPCRRRMSARRRQFQTTQASPKTEADPILRIPLSGPIGRLVSFQQEELVSIGRQEKATGEPPAPAGNPVKLGLPDFDDCEQARVRLSTGGDL